MNTKMIPEILTFIAANLVGFFSLSICFYSLLIAGIIEEDFFSVHGAASFQNWSSGILIVWIICALFSIGGLFLKKKERYILLIAPAVVPLVYGFTTLLFS